MRRKVRPHAEFDIRICCGEGWGASMSARCRIDKSFETTRRAGKDLLGYRSKLGTMVEKTEYAERIFITAG